MYYLKYKSGPTLIEFTNSFSGKETVIANGILVSEKSSTLGTDHHFNVVEQGNTVRYTLRTKIGGQTMVLVDIIREGQFITKNEIVPYGNRGRQSKQVKEGLKLLRAYDLDAALEAFSAGLNADPDNADMHFYKACAHSLLEQSQEAFSHLELAIEHGLGNRQKVLVEDALAFVRMEKAFEEFCARYGINIPESW